MAVVNRSCLGGFTTFICLLLGLVPSSYAERVGFTFSGVLIPPGPPAAVELFGIPVDNNSPFDGALSYDVPSNGILGVEPDEKDFAQQISGGFTLNIGSSIHLSASDFTIQVINDFEIDTDVFVDVFGVVFSRTASSGPTLLLNGSSYPNAADISVYLDWPREMFDDPDEPKLTADRPTAAPNERGSFGFISGGGVALVQVNIVDAIPTKLGDYNRDGKCDLNDYNEWRGAFSGAYETAAYADGNSDHAIDGADYVVWRHCLQAGAALSSEFLGVPEPSTVALLSWGIATCTVMRRRSFVVRFSDSQRS